MLRSIASALGVPYEDLLLLPDILMSLLMNRVAELSLPVSEIRSGEIDQVNQ